MDHFRSLIDTYLNNYEEYDYGKILFECEYGELIFIKDNLRPNTIIVYEIYIGTKYRQQGLCRGIIQYLIEKCSYKFNYLCIESVLSNILYNYLERFNYKGKRFKIKKFGFICSLH